VPNLSTEVTEVVTGLGTLGFKTLDEALEARTAVMIDVSDAVWNRVGSAVADGQFRGIVQAAWENGCAFLGAKDGLRNRRPLRVEWRGPHQTPGFDLLPVDLRIDHVFLVSCKYLSHILFNASPPHLFDRLLANRHGLGNVDWYLEVARDAYLAFYSNVRRFLASETVLPEDMNDLEPHDRQRISAQLRGPNLPSQLRDPYQSFCAAVSSATAERWRGRLASVAAREEMLWRLLRIGSAPYYVLGSSTTDSLRLRVYTPWDWRREFALHSFVISAALEAGQPIVRWKAAVRRRAHQAEVQVDGHVEVRWSHGRFCGHPEAKVYLDTPHGQVPGYAPLR
jgi:hypothetical protein